MRASTVPLSPFAPAYSIGSRQDSNGYRVRRADGTFVGWLYNMDYLEGFEGLYGAISVASPDYQDRSLYREGLQNRRAAANWLVTRFGQSCALCQ